MRFSAKRPEASPAEIARSSAKGAKGLRKFLPE